MPRGKSTLIAAISAGLIAGAIVAPSSASAGTESIEPCGTSVTWTAWAQSSPGISYRDWYWTYYNCSTSTVHRRVIVDNGTDSSCYSIGYKGGASMHRREVNTYGFHQDVYQSTVSC